MTFLSSMKKKLAISITSIMLVACSNSNSQSALSNTEATASITSEEVISNLQKNLDTSGIEATVLSATPTQVNGLYWVTAENVPAFLADAQGKHIVQGQVIEIGGSEPIDITAKLNATLIQESLETVDKKDLIIFPAIGETVASIYVFTDPTCPYCRKFDDQVKELNEKGVEVRYLAWPRSQQALPIMESIWCSEDRNKAMTQSMQNIPLAPVTCDSPVRDQAKLGYKIGVTGTPAVYTESGEQLGGYLPIDKLMEALGL